MEKLHGMLVQQHPGLFSTICMDGVCDCGRLLAAGMYEPSSATRRGRWPPLDGARIAGYYEIDGIGKGDVVWTPSLSPQCATEVGNRTLDQHVQVLRDVGLGNLCHWKAHGGHLGPCHPDWLYFEAAEPGAAPVLADEDCAGDAEDVRALKEVSRARRERSWLMCRGPYDQPRMVGCLYNSMRVAFADEGMVDEPILMHIDELEGNAVLWKGRLSEVEQKWLVERSPFPIEVPCDACGRKLLMGRVDISTATETEISTDYTDCGYGPRGELHCYYHGLRAYWFNDGETVLLLEELPDEQLELQGIRGDRENDLVQAFLRVRKLAQQASLPTICGLGITRKRYWEYHVLHRLDKDNILEEVESDAGSSTGGNWQDASPPSMPVNTLTSLSPPSFLLSSSSPGNVPFERSSTLVSPVGGDFEEECMGGDGPDGAIWTYHGSMQKSAISPLDNEKGGEDVAFARVKKRERPPSAQVTPRKIKRVARREESPSISSAMDMTRVDRALAEALDDSEMAEVESEDDFGELEVRRKLSFGGAVDE